MSGKGVGVAVLDSGVNGTQGDFENMVQNVKIVAFVVDVGASGALYVELDDTDTTSGHGTHVASAIGGTGAMSDGRYTGIAPESQLVSIGAGDELFILYALEGFDYALGPDNRAAYNIRVISNSWGSSGDFAPYNPISIAIAARAATGAVTPPYEGDLQYGAFYSMIPGTLMATPHISGVVALMLEANPSLTLDGILNIFEGTAEPMSYSGGQRQLWEVGYGYVDAFAAVPCSRLRLPGTALSPRRKPSTPGAARWT